MENQIKNKIKSNSLTKTEKKIALYFIENKKELIFKNSKEIAKILEVSDTSVIRFVKSLGFENFKEFKNSIIKKKEKKIITPTDKLEKNLNLLENEKINSNFISNTQLQINNIFKPENLKIIDEIIETLLNSKKKYIAGFKSVAGPASFFSLRLGFLFPDVITCTENNSELMKNIMDLNEEDLLMLVVYPKYSKIHKLLIDLARKKKAKIIIITDSPESPYAYQGDTNLFVSPVGISYFNSVIPLQTLMEYILTDLSSKVGSDSKTRLEEVNELLELRI